MVHPAWYLQEWLLEGLTQFLVQIRLRVMQDTTWCYGGTPWLLPGDFLIVWGARWGPLMRAQPYRWLTSWFLHESFVHILSNMLLFLVIAVQVRHWQQLTWCHAMAVLP